MNYFLKAFLLLLVFYSQLFAQQENSLKISIANDMIPYSFLNENNEPEGILVDYWKLWSEKTNQKIVFVPSTWEQSLENIRNKNVDIHSGLFINKHRQEYVDFVKPIYNAVSSVYINIKDSNEIKNINDLNDKTIGIISNTYYENYLKENYPNINIKTYTSYPELFNAVIYKEIDSFMEDSLNTWFQLIKYMKFKSVTTLSDFRLNKMYYAGVAKGDSKLKKIVLDGMNKISNNEVLEIEKKWIIDDNLRFLKNIQSSQLLNFKQRAWLRENEVELAVTKKWQRFSFEEDDGVIRGFHIDLINLINKNLKTNLKIKAYNSWSEAYNSSKAGLTDGIMGLSWSKDREKFFKYSPFYYYTPTYIVTHKKSSIKSLENLENKKVAGFKGAITTKILNDKVKNVNVITFEKVEDILESVESGKSDAAFIINAKNVDLGIYGLKIAATVFSKEGRVHIGVHKDNDMLLQILETGLNSISLNQMNLMKDKWFNDKDKKTIFTQDEVQYIKNSPPIKIGVDDWAPIYYLDNKGDFVGLAGDFFNQISEVSGLKFEVVSGSWMEILEGVKNKKVDVLPAVFYTKGRSEYGLYTDSYYDIRTLIYVREKDNSIKSFADLSGKRLALLKGDAREEDIRKKFPKIKIVGTSSTRDSIRKLLNNEVDAIAILDIIIEHILKKELIRGIKGIYQDDIDVKPIHIFSRKDDLILNSILQKSLNSISNMQKNRITSKWLSKDFNTQVNVAFGVGREPYTLDKAYLKGIEFDLIKKILSKIDIEIKNVKNYDLNELDYVLENDSSFDMSVTVKEKKDQNYYSDDFINFNNVVVSRVEDNLHINTINDLKDKKIIAFEGAYKYLGEEYFKIFNPNNEPENYFEVRLQEYQVRDFLDKKVDVIVIDKNIFLWYLKKLSSADKSRYKFDFIFPKKNAYKIAFRDKNLRNAFNEGLEQIKKSGEYEQIIYNYIENDIEAKVEVSALISTILSKYIFKDEVRELKKIVDILTSVPYINKIEVFNNENVLLLSTSNKKYTNLYSQDSYFLNSNIPQKVGYINIYFDEPKLTKYSDESNIIPSIEKFEKVNSYAYIKDIYKRFDYLSKKLEFTKKEKEFIANHPILTFSESDWPPLSIIDDIEFAGILSDYMKIIEEKTGIEFKYKKIERWSEVLKAFKNKEIDFVPGVANTKQILDLGLVSDKFTSFNFAVVTNKDGTFVENLSGLEGKIVAIPKGFTSSIIVKEKYPLIKVRDTTSVKEALTLVSQGKAYAFIGHEAVSAFNITNFFPDLKIVGLANEKFEHHMLIQNEDEVLLSIINKVIASISLKQKQDIKNKWIKTKIDTAVDYSLLYRTILFFTLALSIALVILRKLSNAKKQTEEANLRLNESLVKLVRTQDELTKSNTELNTTIKNLRKTQNKLIESEKMASLGGLVAGVAHEINTPIGIGLTGITHLLEITKDIKRNYEDENMSQEEFEKYLRTADELSVLINSNLHKTAYLVKSFKQVAVDQTSEEKREFNLKNYTDEILLSLGNITKKTNLKIDVTCNDDLVINSYPGALSQVLTNLIINSIKHGFEEKEEGSILVSFEKEENSIKLIYKDSGRGIPQENLERIFEPFFTTSRDKGGTGLGLNIIYNIVTNNLNGSIICNSSEGNGVEFVIIFPL